MLRLKGFKLLKNYILLFSIFYLSSINAQSFDWVKGFGSAFEDNGYAVCIDSSDDIILVGRFRDTIDFMPNSTSSPIVASGGFDAFAIKLNQEGEVIWVRTFGGDGNDNAKAVCTDNEGNIFIGGQFSNTANFNIGPNPFLLSSEGNFDAFVVKLDASGNFLWAKSFGGSGPEDVYSIVTDSQGSIHTAGIFYNTVDFNPSIEMLNITAVGQDDGFVLKLSGAGDFVWVKTYGSSSSDVVSSINIDFNGNLLIAGWFRGSINFDSNGSPEGNLTAVGDNWDSFILKLDINGEFQWVKSFGGDDVERINDIRTDLSGNIYTTGYFDGTTDFNPGMGTSNITSTQSSDDAFITKLDEEGNFLWAKALKGSQNCVGNSIAIDVNGDSYCVGEFRGTVDFDPSSGNENISSDGGADLFIQKMDASGNFLSVISLGSSQNDVAASIAINSSNELLIAGEFMQSVDFNPSSDEEIIISEGSEDIFLLKLLPLTTSTKNLSIESDISIYPNPVFEQFRIFFKTPVDYANLSLLNSLGKLVWEDYTDFPSNTSFRLFVEPGIYFLRVNTNLGEDIVKLVKK